MSNFNFKKNWEKLCMPVMRTERIQTAIKKGVIGFLKNSKNVYIEGKLSDEQRGLEYTNKKEYKKILREKETECIDIFNKGRWKYIKGEYPIYYARVDAICDIEEDIEERVTKLLIENGVLKKDENDTIDFTKIYESGEFSGLEEDLMYDYFGSEKYEQYQKYKNSVIGPYMNNERDKDYRYYCLWGGCHWYSASFGIELARMVMPNITWKLIEGDIHTTVVSDDEKLVFDILYYDEKDTVTYGGNAAVRDATRIE